MKLFAKACGLLLVLYLYVAVCHAEEPMAKAPQTDIGPITPDEECRPAEIAAGKPQPYDPQLVERLLAEVPKSGDARRGADVFVNVKSACMQCHKIGEHGGGVGPELTKIGADRDLKHIIESIFWPKRDVKPEFVSWSIITSDGRTLTGYKTKVEGDTISFFNPTTGTTEELKRDDIEDEIETGTLMPDGLTAQMTPQEQVDLIRFISGLGRDESALAAMDLAIAALRMHEPVKFEYELGPLHPEDHRFHKAPINKHRLYDFYAKQADHFRQQDPVPMVLAEFPGLDAGAFGHWGHQTSEDWDDGRWNDMDIGSVQGGVFRAKDITVGRGVCVRLDDQISVCFNPDALTYEAVWKGGFVKFGDARHGFLDGVKPDGKLLPKPEVERPTEPFKYRGYYRHGDQVVFAYRIGDTEYLDAPTVEDGQFVRKVAPADSHPLKHLTEGGPSQWPQTIEKRIRFGDGEPYAIDTFELPWDSPWKSLMFMGGVDFLSNGDAIVSTIQGEVWRVSGLDAPREKPIATWRRIAAGLHHALGVVVVEDQIYVQGRDQITRLHDLNGDGEADFYECFSNAFETSPAGHDFICDLQRDDEGNFYIGSGNQGLVKISPDGERAEVLATGIRNPDGVGLLGDGTLTLPASEGEWTPASMILVVRPNDPARTSPPHFGYMGPRDGQPPDLPLAYLPRGVDNSSGGQTYIDSDKWGPLKGAFIHYGSGPGNHFLVLRDEVDGQMQGAVVPLPGDFESGVHRGRFHPIDGQLYVTGMKGWGCFTPEDGCFERVRYTGAPVQLPINFHVHQNGVTVKFTRPIDRSIAAEASRHFAQCWNYRYSEGYGSPEYSPSHRNTRGHDSLRIASAHVIDDHTLFLELPDLQPVNQLHLRLEVDASGRRHELFVTVHKLDRPFEDFPGYKPVEKTIAVHPLLVDLATEAKRIPNPFTKRIKDARRIFLVTGKNLTFADKTIRVKAGEPIQFLLFNPDVVPHNWALAKKGTLQKVGDLANRLIADPDAVARHYIPQTDDILYYTDVVNPGGFFGIYFRAPEEPGEYPYLCTFPGHWMVMNGTLIVE